MRTAATISRTAGGAATLSVALSLVAVSPVAACTITPADPMATAVNSFVRNLLNNRRVAQTPDCSFVNGGEWDEFTGDPAVDLGKGRIAQVLRDGGRASHVMVVVCGEHQAVFLDGKYDEEPGGVGCGGQPIDLMSYLPGSGAFDYGKGKDFAGFLAYMESVGMLYNEDITRSMKMARAKDRVDLLCGCEVFYPDTVKN